MKLAIGSAEVPEAARTYPEPWSAAPGTAVAVPVEGAALRLVVAWLGSGGWIRWPDRQGEEALYVLDGSLEVDGVVVPAGGAVVLHADEPCSVAATSPTRVAHFSARHASLGASGGGGKHLLGAGGWFRSGSPEASQATWFADSTCAGCDVALFRVERDTPGNRGRAHSHSADEILFVVEGGIRLGGHPLPRDHAVLIPADTRYAVTCGDSKHGFLNYRASASTQRYEGDEVPLPESGVGRGGQLVGDFLT